MLTGGPHYWTHRATQGDPRVLRLTNCGGLGCIFSRGFVNTLSYEELAAPDCRECTPGMADQQLSYCLFFKSGIAPIGLPGISWGEQSQHLLDILLLNFTRCETRCAGGIGQQACGSACSAQFRVGDWLAIHMRWKGRAWRGLPLAQLIQMQHAVEQRVRTSLAMSSGEAVHNLCCALVHKRLKQCTNGCLPEPATAHGEGRGTKGIVAGPEANACALTA